MIEAVVALPVFVIVLAASVYFHALIAASQDARATAGALAWRAAMHGCTDDERARAHVTEGEPLPHGDEITTAANDKAASGSMFGTLGDIPIVGGMVSSLVPRGIEATHEIAVHQPAALQFAGGLARGRAYVACNETPIDPWQETLNLFTSMWSGKP